MCVVYMCMCIYVCVSVYGVYVCVSGAYMCMCLCMVGSGESFPVFVLRQSLIEHQAKLLLRR